MKLIKWTDERGWLRQSWIGDNESEDQAPEGIPANPPDLSQLDYEEIFKELNNLLVERGLITFLGREISETEGPGTKSIKQTGH